MPLTYLYPFDVAPLLRTNTMKPSVQMVSAETHSQQLITTKTPTPQTHTRLAVHVADCGWEIKIRCYFPSPLLRCCDAANHRRPTLIQNTLLLKSVTILNRKTPRHGKLDRCLIVPQGCAASVTVAPHPSSQHSVRGLWSLFNSFMLSDDLWWNVEITNVDNLCFLNDYKSNRACGSHKSRVKIIKHVCIGKLHGVVFHLLLHSSIFPLTTNCLFLIQRLVSVCCDLLQLV